MNSRSCCSFWITNWPDNQIHKLNCMYCGYFNLHTCSKYNPEFRLSLINRAETMNKLEWHSVERIPPLRPNSSLMNPPLKSLDPHFYFGSAPKFTQLINISPLNMPHFLKSRSTNLFLGNFAMFQIELALLTDLLREIIPKKMLGHLWLRQENMVMTEFHRLSLLVSLCFSP